MIEYIAEYNNEDRPYICKKFTASSSEEVHTAININSTQELDSLSSEIIYSHMQNVLLYITNISEQLQIIQLNENTGLEPWPIKKWSEIEWSKEECILWWKYIYYKDNPTRGQEDTIIENNFTIEHGHSDSEDHTHDTDTNETVSDA